MEKKGSVNESEEAKGDLSRNSTSEKPQSMPEELRSSVLKRETLKEDAYDM